METIFHNSKSSYNTSVVSDDHFENADKNILAKIKRLKIEQNHISHYLRKSISSNGYIAQFVDNFSQVSDCQKFRTNINDSYRNVKSLYEYVKANTSNPESLKAIDLDEIKMAILELEEKMKALKIYLQSELLFLEREEKELIQNINENPARIYKIKKQPKVNSVSHNEIVPSPVKEIINSSFRCLEVQQFQDFIASSGSRHGGWNEYYHNIFIRSWNKYIQINCTLDLESYIINVMKSGAYQTLLNDLLSKLPAFKNEEIIAHSQWYLRYIYLKERQNLAIAKWREKRILIKKQASNGKAKQDDIHKISKSDVENDKNQCSRKNNCVLIKASLHHVLSNSRRYIDDACENTAMDEENINLSRGTGDCRRTLVKYTTPTKQWINRCQKVYNKPRNEFNYPVHIEKLQIPKWRLGLQDI